MKIIFRTLTIIPVLLMVLVAACSAPEDPNNNGAAPANQNEVQTTMVNSAPAEPAPQPAADVPAAKPAEPAAANGKGSPSPPASGGVPKLFVPKTVIDFGKQPKEKTLARTFVIKNNGNAELNIEAVEPS